MASVRNEETGRKVVSMSTDSNRIDEPAAASSDDDLSKYRFDRSTIKHRTPKHPTRDGLEVLSYDFNAAPFEHMAWMRKNAPTYWDDTEGIWAITHHADIVNIERDAETFCSGKGSRPNSSVPSMINSDPPEHTRRRGIVSGGFTPRRIAGHEEFLRSVVDELIDKVESDGGCDFVTAIAQSIPLRMIAELMGLPAADETKLLYWSDLFAAGGEDTRREVQQAVLEWIDYIVGHIYSRSDPDAEDLISLLMYADGQPLTTEELICETMLILVGGDETTRHVMSGGLEALLQHPDQWNALKADPGLLNGAIEEMLRWVTPVRNMSRTATCDIEFEGQQILEGDRVLLLYASGNRDETVFERPDEFDIMRSPNPHVAFGASGHHFCLGAQLARLELRVMFTQIIKRLPDIRLVEPDVKQPERRGTFVLGLEHLPVEW